LPRHGQRFSSQIQDSGLILHDASKENKKFSKNVSRYVVQEKERAKVVAVLAADLAFE
jgi:hypothetical protein